MTDADWRALELLATLKDRLVRPGFFGSELWPNKHRKTWAFARPAGRVLNRLREQGFATWEHKGKTWGWRITVKGETALRERHGAIEEVA